MNTPFLSLSCRLRSTPFSRRVEAAGLRGYTVYNHMLLPTVFESLEADSAHLKRHVQVWDVSCQRQIEVRGPDAHRLLQLCTPRDLSALVPGRCLYSPLVDAAGGMLNDPVILQVGDRRYWVSIADADIGLWMGGLAHGLGLDAVVEEAEVHPLAIQGPKAEELAARVLGDDVRAIGFFRYRRLAFAGRELIVARSGFSRQGGFEIYVDDAALAEPLWDAFMDAGADLQVRAGGPSLIERIEGGMLSYGNDMTRADTPYECGLGALCRLDTDPPCLAAAALAGQAANGPGRMIRGLRIEGEPVPVCRAPWPVHAAGSAAGRVSSATWSPDCATNVAIAMIEAAQRAPGTRVEVECPDATRAATVCALPHL